MLVPDWVLDHQWEARMLEPDWVLGHQREARMLESDWVCIKASQAAGLEHPDGVSSPQCSEAGLGGQCPSHVLLEKGRGRLLLTAVLSAM